MSLNGFKYNDYSNDGSDEGWPHNNDKMFNLGYDFVLLSIRVTLTWCGKQVSYTKSTLYENHWYYEKYLYVMST